MKDTPTHMDNTETEHLDEIVEAIAGLFNQRERSWIDMCVAIANQLPGAWGCIETHIDARYNLYEVRLIDLKFEPYSEQLVYSLSAENPSGDTRSFFVIEIPLKLAVAAMDDDKFLPLLDYLETVPNVVDQLISEDNPLDLNNMAVADALAQLPGLVVDKGAIIDLHNRLESGAVFLFQAPSRVQ